ncbi:hypothetical protein QF043_000144 [Pseudomonas sp. W3I7]|uniref:hypothetical protein n=1 Tax=Pseudomonas sp. W3I7 TaxID=3042292 RepID=UPI00278DD355|nr:hypothetical protein [Pseudomonas sp. W3I7]MDQ0701352.1 hypothetical protein [Pseudomonas sp. W3I7]
MTYSVHAVLATPDHLLIKPLKAPEYVAYSSTRTPYPQKHQQTLGATSPALWKTTSNLHESGHSGVSASQQGKIDHILINLLKAFIYKAPSRERTSYPQKRQQTLGASLCQVSNLSREKPKQKPSVSLVVFRTEGCRA